MQIQSQPQRLSTKRRYPFIIAVIVVTLIASAAVRGTELPAHFALGLGFACAALGFTAGRKFGSAFIGDRTAVEQQSATNFSAEVSLRHVIDVLDMPAFALGPENTVFAANRGARDLFTDIAIDRPLHQVTRNPGLNMAVQQAREQRSAQKCEFSEYTPLVRRLFVSVSPLFTAGASIEKFGLLVQVRDVSEQDRLTQLRTDFIANASHELRTPLASIKGFVETLQGSASSDAAARTKFLRIMDSQAARMTRILDDLLSLSRIEMREHVLPSDIVDIAQVLATTVESLEPLSREAKITLRFQADPGDARVRGDRDELVQVFQNLIQNAIKYGRADGMVEISLKHRPAQRGAASSILIAVKDDGPGIAEEHLPRLTERFYRVDTVTSRERGGTGLGLAIVKHIVARHRGELKIASTLGKGSAFTVILDAAS